MYISLLVPPYVVISNNITAIQPWVEEQKSLVLDPESKMRETPAQPFSMEEKMTQRQIRRHIANALADHRREMAQQEQQEQQQT
ncbi:unnamed protein product [Amoebophrya sp. A25]|nr:unnamed protein product [Amoebophrya sp. A25]|eukprot:GSA25T00007719001.1